MGCSVAMPIWLHETIYFELINLNSPGQGCS